MFNQSFFSWAGRLHWLDRRGNQYCQRSYPISGTEKYKMRTNLSKKVRPLKVYIFLLFPALIHTPE